MSVKGIALLTCALLMGGVCVEESIAQGQKNKQNKTQKQMEPAPHEPIILDMSQPLTLEKAIQIGLENQNTLKIARSQLDASRARITRAQSSYYPSVAPSYQYTSQLSVFQSNGQTFSSNVEQGLAQLSLQQLIYDMGKRERNVAYSKDAARSSQYNVLDSRQSVIVNVSTDYYELLRRKELVKVAESSVERAQTTLRATEAYAEAGTIPKKDVFQAQADYENARIQLIQARNNVRIGDVNLKNAMGILSNIPLLTPDKPLDPPVETPDPRAKEEYLRLAFEKRFDLRRDQETIKANRQNEKIAQINAGFQVNASVTEGYRFTPESGENRYFITSFSYPLFDAGYTRSAVREARAALDQSRDQLELTKQNIQLDVETAYLLQEEARARYQAARAAVRAAQINYDAAREAQKEGAGTIIDVITAQNSLVTAETNAVQAIYDYYSNQARLQRAIGVNDDLFPEKPDSTKSDLRLKPLSR